MQEIWIEKYRPKTLDDVAGQQSIIERLKAYAKTKNVPHMIFAGNAGTGKTTSALALSKEIFGKETWKQNFHELNASDERGIGIIRGKIKDFARTAPLGETSFKIIFLDEADSLTSDAQAALRRTIEKYTHNCRFILSVNYSSKIIEPIQSRCAMFRFKPLKEDDIKQYIEKIGKNEKLTITDDGLEALVFIAKGDMRKAINILQVGASLNKKITAEFDTLLKRKFVDNVDKYDFLDPFAAEFQYAEGEVEFTGKADEKQLAKGVFENVRELAEDLGILPQLQKELVPWTEKYRRYIEKFDLKL